ncbi:hypothetical protein KCP70_21425 [Salmonella enterica subsp. enterica]|nr:hypothetical protein KCP70_21425 [Salmonella enterica subsp. enterica]
MRLEICWCWTAGIQLFITHAFRALNWKTGRISLFPGGKNHRLPGNEERRTYFSAAGDKFQYPTDKSGQFPAPRYGKRNAKASHLTRRRVWRNGRRRHTFGKTRYSGHCFYG